MPPEGVVRHDSDDSYLVVAADKGTATFSDIANGVAKDYGFWLGDAFASGGSVGYDHKAMGITARGAWVSVQRHFRERGVDCQTEDFTCVGIGDMSGDVFGNGLLCSEHTLLVAAFDHRDIFLDPTPDPAASFAERKRMFGLPRSSWQDYDASLISEGGGVYARSLKSIPISPQVRKALDLGADVTAMTPAELMKAILQAPVDLLWNGGIGTYVKSSDETHADAGDKANDAIRIDGRDLRARCVGEGGNLGLTQLGRIEYAVYGADADRATGGAINTDFIDNSAGVDTSDHEVNIKILLDRVVRDGDLTEKQRNHLLAEMTDEVAALVLRDNYEQNLALANAAANATSLLHVHEDWMKTLERAGVLNRELEGLPTSRGVRRRAERGEGLTTPELSVLLAWTKIVLADKLIDSDLPDDPYCHVDLMAYFPTQLREGFETAIANHPLRREIIVTQVVNDLVNGAGMTFWPRLMGETGATPEELTRANFVAREIFGSLPMREEIKTFDNTLEASTQTLMRDRDAHPGRARVALAGQQPASAARQPGHGRLLQRAGVAADGRAAVAADGSRAPRLREPPEDAGRPAGARGPRQPRRGPAPGVHAARRHRDRRPDVARPRAGRPAALRARRAARAARPGHPDPGAAARGPLADDGAGGAARRRVRRARPAHRAGAARHLGRRLGAGPDRGVGGRRRRRRPAGGVDPPGDLPGRQRRPGPDVGRSPRGPRAARQLSRTVTRASRVM